MTSIATEKMNALLALCILFATGCGLDRAESPDEENVSTELRAGGVLPAEWDAVGVALVYPNQMGTEDGYVNSRNVLRPYFREYMTAILAYAPVREMTIVLNKGLPTGENSRDVETELRAFLSTRNPRNIAVRFVHVRWQDDIWIRDYGAYTLTDGTALKGLFDPLYYEEMAELAALDDVAGMEVVKELGYTNVQYLKDAHGRKLNVEGGNFLQNGQGDAIAEDAILDENQLPGESLAATYARLSKAVQQLGVTRLIVTPRHPSYANERNLGHIDAYARWASADTVLVASFTQPYPGNPPSNVVTREVYRALQQYVDTMAARFKNEFGFKVMRLPSPIPHNEVLDEGGGRPWPNSYGMYTNYERLGDTIFSAGFGIMDDEVEAVLRQLPGVSRVVRIDGAKDLVPFGGVLHCTSWEYY